MKRNIFFISLIPVFVLIISACGRNDDPGQASGKVELYLMESYETVKNTFQIDESTVVTKESSLISYTEFKSYDSNNYIFTISDNTKTKVENLEHSVHGLAFAIKVDNELIYTGYFWPIYSSMTCDWIITDPIALNRYNGLKMELGYATQTGGIVIPDKRNDKRIIDIFRQDNKLIE